MEIKCIPVPLQSISPTFNKKVQRNTKQLGGGGGGTSIVTYFRGERNNLDFFLQTESEAHLINDQEPYV